MFEVVVLYIFFFFFKVNNILDMEVLLEADSTPIDLVIYVYSNK